MAGTSAYVDRDLISGIDVKTIQGESIVGPGNLDVIGNVNQYSDLPPANTVSNKYFWVRNSQGTRWLPGSIGGTFYNKGLYFSDGITWSNVEVPYQATEAEALAGINNSNFITPFTLKKVKDRKLHSLNFLDYTTTSFVAPYDLKILSISNVVNSPTVAILNGASVYTLGTTVTAGNIITVTVSTASYINLNIEQL